MTLNYFQARKNAMDFRQYLAHYAAQCRAVGYDYESRVGDMIDELAVLSGVSCFEISENLALDVMIIETLSEAA